jgi:hypothetical protein
VEGANLQQKGTVVEVGGYLPPARLELSMLQRPVVLPGQGPGRLAALSCWGVSGSSRWLPSGAANSRPRHEEGFRGAGELGPDVARQKFLDEQGARDVQGLVHQLLRRSLPTMLPTLEMEGAVLDPGVEAGEAGTTRLALLELCLIVCHMQRIWPIVLLGRH